MDGEMSLLDRRRADRPAEPATRERPDGGAFARGRLAASLDLAREHAIRSHEPAGWPGSVLLGCWSALLSLLVIALPVLLAWATTRTSTGWGQAVRVSTQAWLMAHGVALQVPGGRLQLLPLALTALPVWWCWRAGRRVGAGAPKPAGISVGDVARSLAAPVAGLAAGYAVVLTAAALLAHGSGVRPVWWQAIIAGLVVPGLAGGSAALRVALTQAQPNASRRRTLSVVADWVRLPGRLRRVVRPAALATLAIAAAGALLVAVSVVVQHERVLALHDALAPGVPGSVALVLGQLAFVPDLAVWAVAWCAGPGFALGAGTSVTPVASTLGLLPLVPVLGALPSPGPLPAVAHLAVLLPVVLGAALGWRCARRTAPAPGESEGTAGTRSAVLDALAAAALTAAALTVLALASSGSAGPGRLSLVGPSAWRVGLALLLELGAGAAVAAWMTARRPRGSNIGGT
jgi:hypothetical protein